MASKNSNATASPAENNGSQIVVKSTTKAAIISNVPSFFGVSFVLNISKIIKMS
jgi:hypothetical protein